MRKVKFYFLTKGTQPSSGRAGIQTRVVLLENMCLDQGHEAGGPLSWVRRITWSLQRRRVVSAGKCLCQGVMLGQERWNQSQMPPRVKGSTLWISWFSFSKLRAPGHLFPGPAATMIPQSCPSPFFLFYCTLLPHYQVNLLTLNISSGHQTCRYNCLCAAVRCLTVSLRSKPRSPALLAGTCSASNVPRSSCQHHPPTCSSWKAGSYPGHLPLPHPHIPQPVLLVLLNLS